jgi:hypothetical protein
VIVTLAHQGKILQVDMGEATPAMLARALALGAGRCDTRGAELVACRTCIAGSAQQYLDAAKLLRNLFDQLAEAKDRWAKP